MCNSRYIAWNAWDDYKNTMNDKVVDDDGGGEWATRSTIFHWHTHTHTYTVWRLVLAEKSQDMYSHWNNKENSEE